MICGHVSDIILLSRGPRADVKTITTPRPFDTVIIIARYHVLLVSQTEKFASKKWIYIIYMQIHVACTVYITESKIKQYISANTFH